MLFGRGPASSLTIALARRRCFFDQPDKAAAGPGAFRRQAQVPRRRPGSCGRRSRHGTGGGVELHQGVQPGVPPLLRFGNARQIGKRTFHGRRQGIPGIPGGVPGSRRPSFRRGAPSEGGRLPPPGVRHLFGAPDGSLHQRHPHRQRHGAEAPFRGRELRRHQSRRPGRSERRLSGNERRLQKNPGGLPALPGRRTEGGSQAFPHPDHRAGASRHLPSRGRGGNLPGLPLPPGVRRKGRRAKGGGSYP